MNRRQFLCASLPLLAQSRAAAAARLPNIVYMYADDLGYGDVSCYGATRVQTPNLDRAAAAGVRFTQAHSSSATCTPSRYSLLTGEYAWRHQGTGVLPGDASLIVQPGRYTLPAMLKEAGYRTGVVGKWHLGLGARNLDWNGEIAPGPLDVGFDYSFIFPATGDAIAELDWSIGRILDTLDRLKLTRGTLFVFSSDNGPVVDDGYRDQAVEKLGDHQPAGPLRGGKYSAYDGGTRVPFVVRWPGGVKTGVSPAPLSQVDLLASLAALAGRKLPEDAAPDSFNLLPALLGKSRQGRPHIVEHATALSLISGDWKVIQPHNGPKRNQTGNEIGNDPQPQLFNLANDLAEPNNLAAHYPGKVKEMLATLAQIQQDGRSRPR